LAIKSKVPIVPVAISGSREIMPKDKLTAAPGEIRILVGDPIETENCVLKDREWLMKKVREAITKNFSAIAQR
jgi:1-acyl-sn-glycerol-3-phosphate acyltransferase